MKVSAFTAIIVLLAFFSGVLPSAPVYFSKSNAWAQKLPSVLSREFARIIEFPNLFLPAEYREMRPELVPESVIMRSQELLNAALASLFDRLVLPLVPEGQSTPALTRYFPYMRDQVLAVDPSARIYASGGVVRSAISYLYDLIYQSYLSDPSVTPEEVLYRFIHDSRDIPAIRVRGVGSDFDLLVTSMNQASDVIFKTTYLTDSAATWVKVNSMQKSNSPLVKAVARSIT